jgi:hypothetical protein
LADQQISRKKKKNTREKGNSCTISPRWRRPNRLPLAACPAIFATFSSSSITTATRPQPRGTATHSQLHYPSWPSPLLYSPHTLHRPQPPRRPCAPRPSSSPPSCPVRRAVHHCSPLYQRPTDVDTRPAGHTIIGVSTSWSNLLRALLRALLPAVILATAGPHRLLSHLSHCLQKRIQDPGPEAANLHVHAKLSLSVPPARSLSIAVHSSKSSGNLCPAAPNRTRPQPTIALVMRHTGSVPAVAPFVAPH